MAYLDIHVHDRGGKQSKKETPAHALEVARDSNVDGIIVMPNTDPPLFSEELVIAHYNEAMSSGINDIYYGIWMGLTKDPEQIKHAINTFRKLPYVLGFKMYAGHSTGNLGIVEVGGQFLVVDNLAKEGYDGPLLIHAEKEARMNEKIFDSSQPITHAFARPEIAETESIRDQIGFAYMTGFKGKLHFVHVSTSSGVEFINMAKKQGMDVSCGVCPHHLFYDYTAMQNPKGIELKMNPPLRKPGEGSILLEDLRTGRIDFIETDHAPHTLDDKYKECASGVPALAWWKVFEEFLRYNGFAEKRIEEVTFKAAAERFGISIERKNRRLKDRRKDYPFNPWTELEKILAMENSL